MINDSKYLKTDSATSINKRTIKLTLNYFLKLQKNYMPRL